jgi:ribonuclease inhibitor
MREIMIDCAEISTSRSLHNAFAEALSFPEWYGKNLDALHDVLSEESEPIHILLSGMPNSEEMMAYFPKLECVLSDCAQENDRICFERV